MLVKKGSGKFLRPKTVLKPAAELKTPAKSSGGSQLSSYFIDPSKQDEFFANEARKAESRKKRYDNEFIIKSGNVKRVWLRRKDPLFIARIHKFWIPNESRYSTTICTSASGECALCDAQSYAPGYAVYEFIDLDGYSGKRGERKNFSCYYLANDTRRKALTIALKHAQPDVRKCVLEVSCTGTKATTTHLFDITDTSFTPPKEALQADDLSQKFEQDWAPPDAEEMEETAQLYRRVSNSASMEND